MLRKMLIALMAVAALGVGSTAMARVGGGSHGGSFGGGGHGGGFGGGSMRGGAMIRAPMASGRVLGFSGSTFNRNNLRNNFAFNRGFRDQRHFHHLRFHNRNFFAFGFAGPYFDNYGYDCWRLVHTYYGWRRVYVCGDYSYWGY